MAVPTSQAYNNERYDDDEECHVSPIAYQNTNICSAMSDLLSNRVLTYHTIVPL